MEELIPSPHFYMAEGNCCTLLVNMLVPGDRRGFWGEFVVYSLA
ncbi:hypothetical protein J2Z66_003492 [Paenibacillus eucommiae]|uniref:Uncharacterized protein n=1 Tax=Paenibacillus eucommiae TaxID=1355755 RepID=A0ABS4IWB9_9BACL|nr:hypothetical protein [Paenibacillus eucommiae]